MTKTILAIFFILSSLTSHAQRERADSSLHKYFDSCTQDYNQLERIIRTNSIPYNQYLLNGILWTGWAISIDSSRDDVYFFKIENGLVSSQLGYYYNGQINRAFYFKDGLSHGRQVMYHADGSLYIEEFYEGGIPYGTHRRWYSDHSLAREVVYENGEVIDEKLYPQKSTKGFLGY